MIFNAVLRLEYYPSQWKVANIVVIPKPGKPAHEVTSYRPISLLPLMSKVFEKLLLKRLKPVLIENDIIPHHQFGFRHKHSTLEQVHRIVDIISQCLEARKYCSAAYLDVRQAFDKVWHQGLLFKIKSSLPHPYYNLIKSYLENRFFEIKFQDAYSPLVKIESGVPQGSVLGPVLYTIFTADLPVSPGVTVATFADDTALLVSHENPVTASQILQTSLNELSDWLKKWKIEVNENKSSHLTCTLRTQTCPPVSLNNVQLPQVTEVKYLGMHIDRRLTWRSHIWQKRLQLNTKYRKMTWLLSGKSHLSLENRILLYKTVLKPIWTYGISLWGCTSNSNIDIIQRFQSKTLRNILQAPWYMNNKIIHSDTNIPFVKDEITRFSTSYLRKLNDHPNHLAVNLLDNSASLYRLKRQSVLDLPLRFN
uniref:Reverse transcriptase domain-containing protein n=1 Tax=Graphocephala atropunctata TaxID=36148 RepID=A0A1B6KCY8_9HEMI